ncbi:MAG: hypothetical protein Q9184_006352, partial [Pyrenodesmia sp. 2 TL-2023]
QYESFKYLKLTTAPSKLQAVDKGASGKTALMASHIRAHLTGNDKLAMDDLWYKADRKALSAEYEEQKKSLGEFKNCTIVTKRGRNDRYLLVEVYRDQAARDEGVRFDPDSSNLGQSYVLNAPKTFPSDKDYMKEHPVLGSRETLGWIVDVAPETDTNDSGAIFVGMIVNSLGTEGIDKFVDKTESGVSLDPIFNDVQGDRARQSLSRHNDDLANVSKDSHGIWVLPEALNRQKSHLPVDQLFGDLRCAPEENQLPLDAGTQLPAEIAGGLNPVQKECVDQAVRCKVSIIVGPPGTGKSTTLAALIIFLVKNLGQKVAAVAPQNAAVWALLESCIKAWRKLMGPNSSPPFVWVFSQSTILKQWESGDFDKLNSEFHIDYLCHQQALQSPASKREYFIGRAELSQHGRIVDPDTLKEYTKTAANLARQVLESRNVAFSTLATSQSPVLYKQDPMSGDLLWHYRASTIICDEAGTVLRPHLLIAVMSFISATRLVCAGDGKQLPAHMKSIAAQEIWGATCYMDKVIARGYPSKTLNVQYRMHDEIYAHLVGCIYTDVVINSHRLTSTPSQFLKDLLRHPTRFTTRDRESYQLDSFLHFIDVKGEQKKEANGSSFNVQEANAVEALVLALVARPGVVKKDIGVMTGYKGQKRLMRDMAKANGWADIKLLSTVHASQGNEFKIVILSLVSDKGLQEFMGQRSRANLAKALEEQLSIDPDVSVSCQKSAEVILSPVEWAKQAYEAAERLKEDVLAGMSREDDEQGYDETVRDFDSRLDNLRENGRPRTD